MSIRVKEIIFTIIAWAAVLGLVNFLCGLVVKNRYIAVDAVNARNADRSFGYFAPDQDKIILFPGLKEYRVTINSLGLRDVGGPQTLPAIKDKYRILTLGDSMTFGLFVDDKDTYPYRLQAILDARGKRAAVLNAGVGGGVLSDYLYYLKVKGLALKPDMVIISFCENDLEGLDKSPLYERMQNENVSSFGKTLKLTKFMRVFRKIELSYRYQRWLRKTKDERVKTILKEERRDLEDVLWVAAYQGKLPAVDPAAPELRAAWDKNFAVMAETIELLRRHNIRVVFLIYPNILSVFERTKSDSQDIWRKFLAGQDVVLVDPLPVFQAHKAEYLQLYNNLPRDFHLSGAGNRLVAEEIFAKISNYIQ